MIFSDFVLKSSFKLSRGAKSHTESGCECQHRAQVGVKPARKFGNASRKNEVYVLDLRYPRKFPGQFLRQTNRIGDKSIVY